MGFLKDCIGDWFVKSEMDSYKKEMEDYRNQIQKNSGVPKTISNPTKPQQASISGRTQSIIRRLEHRIDSLRREQDNLLAKSGRIDTLTWEEHQALLNIDEQISLANDEITKMKNRSNISYTDSYNDYLNDELTKKSWYEAKRDFDEIANQAIQDITDMPMQDLESLLQETVSEAEEIEEEPTRVQIDARYGIGMIKLALRCCDTRDIEDILDILQNHEYDSEDKVFLNKIRKNILSTWSWDNIKLIREYCKSTDKLKIYNMSSVEDNPRGLSTPEELAMEYRGEFMRANLVVIIDSDTEKIHIVKSRYFNTPIKDS